MNFFFSIGALVLMGLTAWGFAELVMYILDFDMDYLGIIFASFIVFISFFYYCWRSYH